MTTTLTDNEKYLLKKIELLEKQINKLEWRLLKLEIHSIEAPTTEEDPESQISEEEAEELSLDDNWLNNLIDYVNAYEATNSYIEKTQLDKQSTNR